MHTAQAGEVFGERSVMTTVAGKMVETTLVEVPWTLGIRETAKLSELWKRADGCLVLMDTTKKGEDEYVVDIVNRWMENARKEKMRNVVVCGAKSDVTQRCCAANCIDTMRFCGLRGFVFVDITCKDELSVHKAVNYLLFKALI